MLKISTLEIKDLVDRLEYIKDNINNLDVMNKSFYDYYLSGELASKLAWR